MSPCQVHGSEDCDCTPRNERPSGITPEQRKKLLEAMKSSVDTFSWETRDQINRIDKIFFAGAEALARIQSEESSEGATAQSDDEFISTECAFEVSRPALRHLGEPGMTTLDKGWDDKHEKGIRTGIARYRPLVEELLAALKDANTALVSEGVHASEQSVNFIARAEKMLGENK